MQCFPLQQEERRWQCESSAAEAVKPVVRLRSSWCRTVSEVLEGGLELLSHMKAQRTYDLAKCFSW